jgi:hypothetical protein
MEYGDDDDDDVVVAAADVVAVFTSRFLRNKIGASRPLSNASPPF